MRHRSPGADHSPRGPRPRRPVAPQPRHLPPHSPGACRFTASVTRSLHGPGTRSLHRPGTRPLHRPGTRPLRPAQRDISCASGWPCRAMHDYRAQLGRAGVAGAICRVMHLAAPASRSPGLAQPRPHAAPASRSPGLTQPRPHAAPASRSPGLSQPRPLAAPASRGPGLSRARLAPASPPRTETHLAAPGAAPQTTSAPPRRAAQTETHPTHATQLARSCSRSETNAPCSVAGTGSSLPVPSATPPTVVDQSL